MGFNEVIANPLLWIGLTFTFVILFIIQFIFIILLGKKTHAIIEFKAWMKGRPIGLFFQENRYCIWKPVEPEAGIIVDKKFGAFIINERATYIDQTTKNILIPFDSQFGASINVHSAKLADDLQYVMKDEEELKKLRFAIAHGLVEDNTTIDCLKTSIHIGAIKNMMTALIPHNVNAKIEKMVAARMKQIGQINVPQVALLFAAVLGAIVIAYLIIRLVAK